MYQLIHQCFGHTTVLTTFDKHPTPKQIKDSLPVYIQLDDIRLDTLIISQYLTLAVGEWLEIIEAS